MRIIGKKRWTLKRSETTTTADSPAKICSMPRRPPDVELRCLQFEQSHHGPDTKGANGKCSWTEGCAAPPSVSAEVHWLGKDRRAWFAVCAEHHLRLHQYFHVIDPAPVAEATHLLESLATSFAAACRSLPAHEKDSERRGQLAIGRRGLEDDEATAFLRTFRRGMVDILPDGTFTLPGCRQCPSELHLIGRSGDITALHTEYLIHIGVVAELVDDYGWALADLAFEQGEWDLYGFSDGRVTLAAEAKARSSKHDADSLASLLESLRGLSEDRTLPVKKNHERKWDALRALAAAGPLDVLLVASGARWWMKAELDQDGHLRIEG